MLGKILKFRNADFEVKSFLGKGKSGYSYLIENDTERYVLKKIHNEPCAYYQFGDKLEAEIHAYNTLKNIGINIPSLVEYNYHEKYLIKEYIEGETASLLIAKNSITHGILGQLFQIAGRALANGINLDYFPTNFIVDNDLLWYIDYELNQYTEAWNLENWGIFYWLNTKGMKEYLKTNDLLSLNVDYDSGIPIKSPFYKAAEELIKGFSKKY